MKGPTFSPIVAYENAEEGMQWLERAFGFERAVVVRDESGTLAHVELAHDGGIVMVGSTESFRAQGAASGPTSVYVVVEDPDALYERAVAAGAEVVRELVDTDYGSRDFGVRDPGGNVWNFGTFRPDPELRAEA